MTLNGLDCGTGNFVVSSDAGTEIERNAFLTIDKGAVNKKQLKRMGIPFVEIGDNFHLIGQRAFEYANILPNAELRRPMASGLLNPAEKDALPILRHIVGRLLGAENIPGSKVTYCIPAKPIDVDREVDYHEDVLAKIITSFGFKAQSVLEAFALANFGLKEDNVTGIAISMGSGMINVNISFMGMSAINFALSKSGDWIDKQVAADCGIPIAKAQQIKEKANYSIAPGSKLETREHNAIKTYYSSLIRYILANIATQFSSSESVPTFPNPVPIVIGGGTSMPEGFIELFNEQFTQDDFPIDVSEIRLVNEPFIAVSKGCLEVAKLEEDDEEDNV